MRIRIGRLVVLAVGTALRVVLQIVPPDPPPPPADAVVEEPASRTSVASDTDRTSAARSSVRPSG